MTVMAAGGYPSVAPTVKYSFGQSSIKGEDVIVVLPRNPWPQRAPDGSDPTTDEGELGPNDGIFDDFALYCVFDGHNGVLAAQYISDTLLPRLVQKLPAGRPPAQTSPSFKLWREGIVRALAEVLSEIHLSFAKLGQLAGCTVTIVLQTGWLVTCANLGDSRAVVDNGESVVQMTEDHRVATNQSERRRVEGNGASIAPVCASGMGPAKDVNNGVGPLRIWPGGVCLSRGIGDFDVGSVIVPWPHVTQVRVPESGARLMLASDGVWDAFDHMSRVFKLSRNWPVDVVPQRMISSIVRAHGGLRDDTSIIVVDIMPPGRDFQENNKKNGVMTAAKSGCFCFSVKQEPEHQEPAMVIGPIETLVHQDIAQVLGQMSPADSQAQAVWVTDDLKSKFLENHALAFETWKRAAMDGALDVTPRQSANPAALQPSTPNLEDLTVHAGRLRANAPGTEAPGPAPGRPVAPNPADYSVRAGDLYGGRPARGRLMQGGSDKHSVGDASTRFRGNVASDEADYATRFGPYRRGDDSSHEASSLQHMDTMVGHQDDVGAKPKRADDSAHGDTGASEALSQT